MSTLQLENIGHPDAAGNALEFGADGSITNNVNYTGDVSVNSHLKVGKANIVQQYPTYGYVADFQASTGNQTYISISTPQDATLGDTGLVIGVDTSAYRITGRENKYMRLATSNLDRVIVDPSGRVTTPYQPAFIAYMGVSNYSISANTDEPNLQSTRYNNGNHYSTSTRRFTAPVAGVYYFHGTVNCYSIASGSKFRAQLNYNTGGQLFFGDYISVGGDGGDYNVSVSLVINMAANDTMHLENWSSDTDRTYSNGIAWNRFMGYLIG